MASSLTDGAGNALDEAPVDRRRRLELLQDCRERALSKLGGLIGDAFGRIGDELTELALRERRRDAQQVLLDTVSLVRRHRSELSMHFQDVFPTLFDQRMQGDTSGGQNTAAATGGLSLMDDSELSEQIALDRLSQRSRSRLDPESQLGIRARLAELVDREWFGESESPLAPDALLEALRTALSRVQAPPALRDEALRALEPHVTAGLDELYASLNEQLRAAHILPVVRAKAVTSPGGRTGGGGADAADGASGLSPTTQIGGGAAGGGHGNAGGGYGNAGGAGNAAGAGGAPGVGLITPAHFGTLLQQYASGVAGARRSAASVLVDARAFDAVGLQETVVDPRLMETLSAIQAGYGGGAGAGVNMQAAMIEQTAQKGSALDQLTAEIVSIVFDHLYADRRLPDSIKQQLLRLQIVALKAALIDRSFFARSTHPMRRLIDMISEASIDPDADVGPDSPFTGGVTQIVDWLIASFDKDLSVFSDAAVRFETLQASERSRNTERQEALQREGERLDALKAAEEDARESISTRIGSDTPRFVVDFLRDTWVRAVAALRLEHGEAAGRAALAYADMLVWSVAPKTAEDIPKLASMLPKMITEIRRGIAPLDLSDSERQGFFERLMSWHTRAIREAKTPGSTTPSMDELDELVPVADEATTLSDNAYDRIDALRLGDNIEVVELDGARVRLRLAWLSPSRRLFMLTRFPDIARPVGRLELAALMDSGRARTVGGATALDRAIAAIAAIADRRSATPR